MRAAAEPLPDDPDNRREDEIQVTRISDSSNVSIWYTLYKMGIESLTPLHQPHDPLVGVLDYIIQVRPHEYYY